MIFLHMGKKKKFVINVKERQMGKLKGLVTEHGEHGAQQILNELRVIAKMERKYSIKEIRNAVDIAVGDDGRRGREVVDILINENF